MVSPAPVAEPATAWLLVVLTTVMAFAAVAASSVTANFAWMVKAPFASTLPVGVTIGSARGCAPSGSTPNGTKASGSGVADPEVTSPWPVAVVKGTREDCGAVRAGPGRSKAAV